MTWSSRATSVSSDGPDPRWPVCVNVVTEDFTEVSWCEFLVLVVHKCSTCNFLLTDGLTPETHRHGSTHRGRVLAERYLRVCTCAHTWCLDPQPPLPDSVCLIRSLHTNTFDQRHNEIDLCQVT